MIEIKELTKIYNSKKKNKHKALDNINLYLPDKGLVFIIGKSGSGKSTLLNLLGGLDSSTGGKIIIDGNEITSFKEKELCNYRNNHIGFIFQDYHLLDELTVYENIVLSLNLNRIEDNGLVLKALERVGLDGYQDRYPQELSGGERQRVAIARSIVKNPYLILADEPTGNLDNVTATTIIEILKDLSKDCLILIVSHNTVDTYKYADRIIRLSNGCIISDESRNPEYNDYIVYDNDVLIYPSDRLLSEEDVSDINNKLSNSSIKKIFRVEDKYIKTNFDDNGFRKKDIERTSLSFSNVFKLSLTFLKSKIFRIVASSFMIAVIMVILALSQTIITFKSDKIIKEELDKVEINSLFMEKLQSKEEQALANQKYYVEVPSEDISTFKEAGYGGDIYEVLNHTLTINTSWKFFGKYTGDFFDTFHLYETLGTIIVSEDFLDDRFNGLEYVCKLDNFHPSGVIITDYVADSLLYEKTKLNAKNYNDLLGELYFSVTRYNKGYVNGIIKTDYKNRYKDLFEFISLNPDLKYNDLIENADFKDFVNEIYYSLGYSYTLNENFKNDFVEENYYDSLWHFTLTVNDVEVEEDSLCYISKDKNNDFDLVDNEVMFEFNEYNQIFGTSYALSNLNSFSPHEVTIKQYKLYDHENIILEEKVYIKGLYSKSYLHGTMYVSDDLYKKFASNVLFTKGLYFDGSENLENVITISNELNYVQKVSVLDGILTMTKAVDVFIPIFELVAIVLCAAIVLILISFSTKMIRDKLHDIGILKALGCKNNTIGFIFGLQLLLIALSTIVLSIVGYFFFIDLANDVLIESLKALAPGHIVLDLKFLNFDINISLVNALLVIILSVFSFIVPMLNIYKIQPVKIINTKE